MDRVSQQGVGVDQAVDAARADVDTRLREVERTHGLRVLFACESGSRAWGFASTNSDFDVRFIYVRPVEAYLRLRPPVDAFDLHSGDDFDLAGWDVRKTAELMRKSNPPLLEWLASPIIYESDGELTPRLTELARVYFDPKKTVYHYLSLASKHWKDFLVEASRPVRKKYLYAIRPLACIRFIERHGFQPPTLFDEVLKGIDLNDDVRHAVAVLVEAKRGAEELGTAEPDPVLNAWIAGELTEAERIAESLEPNRVSNEALDAWVAHAVLGSGA